jgi:serine/threonine-protein kinase
VPTPLPLADALRDRYTFERELGRGGMATVYLARDLRHDRAVALKVLLPELAIALGPDRFQREIRLAARLQHPHILTVHDSGAVDGLLWYTMPYVEGESLRDRLRRVSQLGLDEALRITREVADALAYAHGLGVVHRDIKPENILLSNHHALVADFGVARAVQAGDTELTGTGMAIGTPAYMSPEQSMGDPNVDGRSDLYSLGCVLYEMLAGEPPYTGPSAQALVIKRMTDPVPSVRRLRDTVPPAVDLALQRALSKTPADRFAGIAEFATALDRASSPPDAVATTAVHPRRWMLAGGALAVVLAALLLRKAGTSHDTIRTAGSGPPIITVLPFQPIGGDTGQRYFTAGMTEEITGQLSRLSSLRVVSSAVAQGYGDSADRLGRMARELGVGSAVSGTVRLAGDKVRIAVQLADARTGQTLWSDQYDRGVANVFEVQSEVARRIAEALRARLTPAESARLEQPQSTSPVAHDLYLRSEVLEVNDPLQNRAGMSLLRQAVAVDSTYADAWSTLATRFFFASVFGDVTYRDSAATAARRSLELRPDLPMGYVVLGSIASEDGRYADARRDFGKALALNPSDVFALADLSDMELGLGRFDEALRLAVQAAPLKGNDAVMYYHVGNALLRLGDDAATEAWLMAGMRKETPPFFRLENLLSALDLLRGRDSAAMERVRALISREPNNDEVQAMLAEVATFTGAADAEQLTSAMTREHPSARSGGLLPESVAAMHGLARFRAGRRAAADSIWAAALEADQRDMAAGREDPSLPVQTAAIHAIRGDSTSALQWLERGYRAGWKDGRTLARDPFFAPLRSSARFRTLLERMDADTRRMRSSLQATTDSLARISRPTA